MAFDPPALRRALIAALDASPDSSLPALCIAYSGGGDSTALLHAAAALRDGDTAIALRAIHVDHGLDAGAAARAAHCLATAEKLGVACEVERLALAPAPGESVEAAAREARYAALRRALTPGEALLVAHSRDDQLETVLLQLVRGAGIAGLAAMPAAAAFGAGRLLRPLLAHGRAELREYLQAVRSESGQAADSAARQTPGEAAGVSWIEDPANADLRYDRVFLRERVLPLLLARWPGAAAAVSRSAAHVAEARALLRQLASVDLRAVDAGDGRLRRDVLARLPPERRRLVLREALQAAGLPLPSAKRLDDLLEQALTAARDRSPRVRWPGAEVRACRNLLYLLPEDTSGPLPEDSLPLEPDQTLALPAGAGTISIGRSPARGLSDAALAQGLTVRFRHGGERLRPAGAPHRRPVKDLLRERGVPPWMRERVPLVYAGETLAAVADWHIADEWSSEPGWKIDWRPAASYR